MAKRRRPLRNAIIYLLVFAAALLGADRLAAFVTARVVASGITSAAADDGVRLTGTRVAIHGFPFLTQLVSREMNHVSGSLDEGQFGGYRVQDVRIDARGLSPTEPWHANHIEVSALVPFSTFETLVADQVGGSVTLGYSSAHAGAIEIATAVLGMELGVAVEPVMLSPTRLGVTVRGFTVAGFPVGVDALPFGLADRFDDISLPLDLPRGVEVDRAFATSEGLRLEAQAADIAIGDLFE